MAEEKTYVPLTPGEPRHDRRADDRIVNQLLGEMRSISSAFRTHADMLLAVQDSQAALHLQMKQLLGAFPDGPLELHRLDHEERIIAAKDARALKSDIRKAAVIGGGASVLGIIGYALLEYAKVILHK